MEAATVVESSTLLRWIPLVPLLGFIANVFLGQRVGRRAAGYLACVCVGISLLLTLELWFQLPDGGLFKDSLFSWIESGTFKVKIALTLDPLTWVMITIITGIGLLIHVYSLGYMAEDNDMVRYFAYLNLFVFFMLLLVLADNLLLFFVGWEGVGLCSYLLIGFWYQDPTNCIAANKAFIVNRIGDACFILGILLLFWELGRQGVWTLDFSDLQTRAALIPTERVTLITLLLFAGATGKSAQIPLYVWLPDAMQGPTPVSALIHAATMVTAGVYMTARLHFLFVLAPATLTCIAWIGVLTALLAATVALAQNDIKRVLAYSTVSQLGYMFVAVGLGAFSAAIFHLLTHAFFKACLFLSAGSVIHGLHGEQDMRKMGGLKAYFPTTYWTYVIAALAISGAPLTAGFFSKDQILWQAFARGSLWIWFVAWLTAGLTAFYMFRQVFLVFHGPCRVEEDLRARIHESPRVMTIPLMLLALGSVVAGWFGTPEYLAGDVLKHWLLPVFGSEGASHGTLIAEILLMLMTVALAAGGAYVAYRTYSPTWPAGTLSRWLERDYNIDELYDLLLVRPMTRVADWFAQILDPAVLDGTVNGLGRRALANSLFWRHLQTGNVQDYLLYFLCGTLLILAYYLY